MFEKENKKMIAQLSGYGVRSASGEFDVDATVEKFRGDCLKFLASRETEDAEIGAAVRAAFDKVAPGTSLNMPYLVGQALAALNAQPENHKTLTDRISNWVRDHAQGETKDGVQARPTSEFVIAKGKGGGVCCRAARAARDAAAAAASAAKAKL